MKARRYQALRAIEVAHPAKAREVPVQTDKLLRKRKKRRKRT